MTTAIDIHGGRVLLGGLFIELTMFALDGSVRDAVDRLARRRAVTAPISEDQPNRFAR